MIGGFLNVLGTGVKALQTYTAYCRAKEVYNDKDRKTADVVDAVFQGAFVVLQVGDVAFSAKAFQVSKFPALGVQDAVSKVSFNKWRTGIRIGTNSAAAVCAITNPIANKGGFRKLNRSDLFNFLAVAAFRAGDGLQQFHQAHPESLKWDPKTVEQGVDLLMTLAEGINHRDSLKKAVIKIGVHIRRCILRRMHGVQRDENLPLNLIPDAANPPDINEAFAAAGATLAIHQIQALIQGLDNNFINLNEIPEILYLTPTFRQNLCCISQTPIRYLLVPNLTEQELKQNSQLVKVKYERAAIDEWRQKHPHENPPHWPATLQFNQDNLKTPVLLQDTIEQNLRDSATEYKDYS